MPCENGTYSLSRISFFFLPIARRRSEEHTSELQSRRDIPFFPKRRSSDLGLDRRVGVAVVAHALRERHVLLVEDLLLLLAHRAAGGGGGVGRGAGGVGAPGRGAHPP